MTTGLVHSERRNQEQERERQSPTTTRVSSGAWLLPDVQADEGAIYWRLPTHGQPRSVMPVTGLLLRFIGLDSDAAIGKFAMQWGPLFPNHAPCRAPFPPVRYDHEHDPDNANCRSLGSFIPEGWESYSVWHRYIRRVRELVETSAALRNPRDGRSDAVLNDFVRLHMQQWPERREDAVQQSLAIEVNELVKIGLVCPRLDWSFGVSFAGDGLFGAIAIQLLAWVGRASGPAFCSGCAEVYLAARQPGRGRMSWCDDCKQLGRHWRHAQRRRREGLARPRRRRTA